MLSEQSPKSMRGKKEAVRKVSETQHPGESSGDPTLASDLILSQSLLDGFPHPAILVERSRQILATNQMAERFGARVGDYCWQELARGCSADSQKERILEEGTGASPEQAKCPCCLADQAMAEKRTTHAAGISAFGRLWDVWWMPLDANRYLHYAVDITSQKQTETELEEYRNKFNELVDSRTEELRAVNERLKIEIDECAQMEKALRESEERFRSMFEKSRAVKLVIDPADGAILNANPAACEFYGYQLDQLKSMKISEINPLPAEDLKEAMVGATVEERKHFFFKHRLASGAFRDVEVHSSPIHSEGRTLLFSIIHDITERRISEELLRLEHNKFLSIASSTENPVFIIDAECNIQYLNPAARRDFGPEAHLKFYEYLSDEGEICSWHKKHESLNDQPFRSVWRSPVNGKTYDVFSTPFRNPEGTVSTLTILHDVTRHKQVEQALRLDEARLAALLDLSQMAESPIEEITNFVLEQIVKLTDSRAGAIVIMNEDKSVFIASSLPQARTASLEPEQELRDYPFGYAGFWNKTMNLREPIIVNNYVAPLASAGQPSLSRLLIAPVVAGNRVIAAAAAANKKRPYQISDARQLMLLLDGMCKIIQRKQSEDAIRESERQLRYLSKKLLTVREQERELLARELHDTVGQTLAAIKYALENAVRSEDPVEDSPTTASLRSLLPIVQTSIQDVRTLYTGLRPTVLDDFGVIAALGWLCRSFNESHGGIHIDRSFDLEEKDVPQALKIIIFRLVQEALNNIASHSKATLVNLSLHKPQGSLLLQIKDNGQGFKLKSHTQTDPDREGLGLPSMKELVELSSGTFVIHSAPGQGTILRAVWPGPV